MNPLNILVIEDDTIIAADIQLTLEEAGHHVTHIARNFQEAIKSVKTFPPDLALIDIKLTNSSADGITTARELLNQHWMPIIYLTSSTESETFQRAKETYPAAYIIKPFHQEQLTLQIELAYHQFHAGQKDTQNLYTSNGSLYLNTDQGHEKILPNDLLFLKAKGSYVEMFLINESKERIVTMNLGNLAHYFSTSNFYRLSRSLFINLNHLTRLGRTQLQMGPKEIKVDISEANRKDLLKKLNIIRAPGKNGKNPDPEED